MSQMSVTPFSSAASISAHERRASGGSRPHHHPHVTTGEPISLNVGEIMILTNRRQDDDWWRWWWWLILIEDDTDDGDDDDYWYWLTLVMMIDFDLRWHWRWWWLILIEDGDGVDDWYWLRMVVTMIIDQLMYLCTTEALLQSPLTSKSREGKSDCRLPSISVDCPTSFKRIYS